MLFSLKFTIFYRFGASLSRRFPYFQEAYNFSTKTKFTTETATKQIKWKFLEHNGPIFTPPYVPLPKAVKFYYNGQAFPLSLDAEEAAYYYSKVMYEDFAKSDIFISNFFNDWRKLMTIEEQSKITKFELCKFEELYAYHKELMESKKQYNKENRQLIKEENERLIEKYGYCIIDGRREKIQNFKLEPPGLFKGRGMHPKMGKLKKRINASDIIINCSEDAKIPEPPPGSKWKEVRHDNTVTWLAAWLDEIHDHTKYIMLSTDSQLRSDMEKAKFEKSRDLHKNIDRIREKYQKDLKSRYLSKRQIGVALYFIDKLAIRSGFEKNEDEGETVGCCSLKVKNIELIEEEEKWIVILNFLGKDSVLYNNEVSVNEIVFKNLKRFLLKKTPEDDVFDKVNSIKLNKYLNKLMEGLTAKVFRTYNASLTLQNNLEKYTKETMNTDEKIASYNKANRDVAILCNHQRTVPPSHEKSMQKLVEKINMTEEAIKQSRKNVKQMKAEANLDVLEKDKTYIKGLKTLERLCNNLNKLKVQRTLKNENKSLLLNTSKVNYLDPRISIAWCKKNGVPIEKIFSKAQQAKFSWAMDTDENFKF